MKTAIVTGSSKGIGEAVSRNLLENNYKVYGISRTAPRIDNSNFIWIQSDLNSLASFKEISDQITEDKIDLIVNNAGVAFAQNGLELTDKEFEEVFNLNFKSPIYLIKALFEKIKGGTVMTVSSVSDRLVGPKFGLYCASKAAISKYVEALSKENSDIKFVTLLPSYVDTPLLRKLHGEGQFSDFEWNEIIKPEQIAEFINDILSEKYKIESGAKIIIATDSLVEDFEYDENLYGYNVSDKKLSNLTLDI